MRVQHYAAVLVGLSTPSIADRLPLSKLKRPGTRAAAIPPVIPSIPETGPGTGKTWPYTLGKSAPHYEVKITMRLAGEGGRQGKLGHSSAVLRWST
jgi:hypothetical protein